MNDEHLLRREAKAYFWILGACQQLGDMGFLRGHPSLHVTTKGIGFWDQIDSEIRVTDLQIRRAVKTSICAGACVNNQRLTVQLLKVFRDDRRKLESIVEHRASGSTDGP